MHMSLPKKLCSSEGDNLYEHIKKMNFYECFSLHCNLFIALSYGRSRTNNGEIKILHERCLRIIYQEKQSSFGELLEKDKSVSIQYRNLQPLAINIYIILKIAYLLSLEGISYGKQ